LRWRDSPQVKIFVFIKSGFYNNLQAWWTQGRP